MEAYEGSVRYVRAARDAGLRRAVVSSSANCRDVLVAAGIEDLFEVRIDGVVAKQEHLRGKPAPDTFLAGARALGLEPTEAAVFEDALAGVAAGRAGGFGLVVGVDRVGQAEALKTHGADIVVTDLAELLDRPMIRQAAFTVEPWALRETHLDLDLLAQTESVFALANGHIGWRANLDEGEPHGLPGSYLNGVYELRPLPYAEAGYGLPESGPDGDQRHQRQADPAARRRRAVRRPLRRAARARAPARLPRRACCTAAPSGCRPPGRRSGSPRPGWCRSPSGRWRRSATRWSRSTARPGSWCSPSCWPTSSCRSPSGDPRAAAVLESPLASEYDSARREQRGPGAQDASAAGCASARRWTT